MLTVPKPTSQLCGASMMRRASGPGPATASSDSGGHHRVEDQGDRVGANLWPTTYLRLSAAMANTKRPASTQPLSG